MADELTQEQQQALGEIDPVHEVKAGEDTPEREAVDAPVAPGWYYWLDGWLRRAGPFASEAEARAAYEGLPQLDGEERR